MKKNRYYKSHKAYKSLPETEKKYLQTLIQNGYSATFISKLLSLCSRYHPLDFLVYVRNNVESENQLSRVVDSFWPSITFSIWNEILQIPKTQFLFLIEWLFRFSPYKTFKSKKLDHWKTLRFKKDIKDFFNLVSDQIHWFWLLPILSKAISTQNSNDIINALSVFYIGNYHQSNEWNELYCRLRLLIETDLADEFFIDVVKVKKILCLYLLSLVWASYTWWNVVINPKEISKLLAKTLNYNIDFREFLDFLWEFGYTDYKIYDDKIHELPLEIYFPSDKSHGIFNYPVLIKGIALDISCLFQKSAQEYFILDIWRSIEWLYDVIFSERYLKDKKSTLYELYCTRFMEKCLSKNECLINPANYQFWNSVILKIGWVVYWDIDFYLFNKESGNLIVFEIKDRRKLWADIYELENIEYLCSASSEIPNRKKGKDGDVYKWVSQLKKIIDFDREKLREKLWLERNIENIHWVFLTSNPSMWWNAIMKKMLESKGLLDLDKYSFMSLSTFEQLIWNACSHWINIDELVLWKQNLPTSKIETVEIVADKFYVNHESIESRSFSHTKSVYQDFDVYLYSMFGHWNGFFPLINNEIEFIKTVDLLFPKLNS
jgi:hypothetical protein